jgi:predicted RNA-binding protein
MCESNIYNKNGDLLMEDVMVVDIDGEKISMTNILNEKRIVYGKFVRLDLEEHNLIIKEEKE